MKEKLHELLDLCLEISEGERFDAFYKFSGHISAIDVYVRPKETTNVWLAEGKCYLDWESPEERIEEIHKNLAQFLDPELKLECIGEKKVTQYPEYKKIAL